MNSSVKLITCQQHRVFQKVYYLQLHYPIKLFGDCILSIGLTAGTNRNIIHGQNKRKRVKKKRKRNHLNIPQVLPMMTMVEYLPPSLAFHKNAWMLVLIKKTQGNQLS